MTDAELNVIARALAPVVRDLIAKSLAVVNVKLSVLEQREARDGRDGLPGVPGLTGERGPFGIDGNDGKDGLNGKDGADGLPGNVGSDGRPGKDGAEGLHGKDGAPGSDGQKGLDGLSGKDGSDGLHGKDGRDGVTLDMGDFVSLTSGDDGRTLAFTFKRGDVEVVQQVKTALILDRGVYTSGKTYEPGDGVTWGGSFWIAKTATSERPGTDAGASSWRLAVKAGRDGKEGKPGPEGKIGPRGEKGTDGRNSYS